MKKVLFVCIENSCRSQMAEGLANSLGKDILMAYSAGSRPSGKIDPQAIQVMVELGIDISCGKSKGFDSLPTQCFDYVVSLGCKDKCPFVASGKNIEWDIEDPRGRSIEVFRETRRQIQTRVEELIRTVSKTEC